MTTVSLIWKSNIAVARSCRDVSEVIRDGAKLKFEMAFFAVLVVLALKARFQSNLPVNVLGLCIMSLLYNERFSLLYRRHFLKTFVSRLFHLCHAQLRSYSIKSSRFFGCLNWLNLCVFFWEKTAFNPGAFAVLWASSITEASIWLVEKSGTDYSQD